MAPKKLSDYERRRLENIKRNTEMMASMNLYSRAQEVSSATKRKRIEPKDKKPITDKKPKAEAPVVIRRSLRTQGKRPIPSLSRGLTDDVVKPPKPTRLDNAYMGKVYNRNLIDTIMSIAEKSQKEFQGERSSEDMIMGTSKAAPLVCRSPREGTGVASKFKLESLTLKSENIEQVVPNRIVNMRFFPSTDRSLLVAGDDSGIIRFWDVDVREQGRNAISSYDVHNAPISGISVHQFSLSKVFTSCRDGFIRLMDIEKESLYLIHSSDDTIYSLSQHPNDPKSLYLGSGQGRLHVWDERAGTFSSSWVLHGHRINTIDFSPGNNNLMATSSTDGTACIWDLRNIDADQTKFLKRVNHGRTVHSAYFSASGTCLATTCANGKIGIVSGVDFVNTTMIHNDNRKGKWSPVSQWREAIWGWDDSHLFVGNVKRGVHVISTAQRKTTMTLKSPTVPLLLATHKCKVGTLAGATKGRQVYIWTSC